MSFFLQAIDVGLASLEYFLVNYAARADTRYDIEAFNIISNFYYPRIKNIFRPLEVRICAQKHLHQQRYQMDKIRTNGNSIGGTLNMKTYGLPLTLASGTTMVRMKCLKCSLPDHFKSYNVPMSDDARIKG